MDIQRVTVVEAIADIDAKKGVAITVAGVVVCDEERCWLASDRDRKDLLDQCLLLQGGKAVRTALLNSVPAAGGGKYLYSHESVVTGIPSRDNNSGFGGTLEILNFYVKTEIGQYVVACLEIGSYRTKLRQFVVYNG